MDLCMHVCMCGVRMDAYNIHMFKSAGFFVQTARKRWRCASSRLPTRACVRLPSEEAIFVQRFAELCKEHGIPDL